MLPLPLSASRLSVLACCFVMLLAACAPISKEAKEELAQPVNCATAEEDLRVLEEERASNAERALQGVTAVTPAGAALGILTGTYGEKVEVTTGEYNEMIDQKMAEIKETCGL